MKNLKLLLTMAALGIFVACGSGSASTTAGSSTMDARTNTSARTDTDVNSRSNARVPDPERASTTTVNRNQSGNRQMQEMYTSLSMTEDQIKQYEAAYNQAQNTWKRDNQNQTMSDDDRRMQRDQSLKSILNNTQYKQYQQWSENNPNTGF